MIAPEGLNWGSDLSGVAQSYGLSDPAGNLMYQLHLYPSAAYTDSAQSALVAPVSELTPIYIGEWGGSHNAGGAGDAADPACWNQTMVNWLNGHDDSWTAWNMWAPSDQSPYPPSFDLITDWSTLTPTPDFGAIVKAGLAPREVNASAPSVVVPAKASPSLVTGASTRLSVSRADAQGQDNFTYTWSTIGMPPANVSYSDNGSHSARDTTVRFTSAGDYAFQVTIANRDGQSTTSTVMVTVQHTLSGLFITPSVISVATGAKQRFTVGGLDQFGRTMAVSSPVAWSVVGRGSISGSGLYKAPASSGSATVKAVAGGLRASLPFKVVRSRQSVSVSFTNTDDWGTGFTGSITITNTGKSAFRGWKLQFDFDGIIASNTTNDIWDAVIVSHIGRRYVIKNAKWNGVIGAGKRVSFGFNTSMSVPHSERPITSSTEAP